MLFYDLGARHSGPDKSAFWECCVGCHNLDIARVNWLPSESRYNKAWVIIQDVSENSKTCPQHYRNNTNMNSKIPEAELIQTQQNSEAGKASQSVKKCPNELFRLHAFSFLPTKWNTNNILHLLPINIDSLHCGSFLRSLNKWHPFERGFLSHYEWKFANGVSFSGALFDEHSGSEEAAFQRGIELVNDDRTILSRSIVDMDIARFPADDSFKVRMIMFDNL